MLFRSVNPEDSVPIGETDFGHLFFQKDTGVMDEEVRSVEVSERLRDGGSVGEVARKVSAGDWWFRAGEQGEGDAFPVERLRNGESNPAAGAGDDGGLTGEGCHRLRARCR